MVRRLFSLDIATEVLVMAIKAGLGEDFIWQKTTRGEYVAKSSLV